MPSDEENVQKIIDKLGGMEINDNVKELYVCFNEIIKEALDLSQGSPQDLPQGLPQDLSQDLPRELRTTDI